MAELWDIYDVNRKKTGRVAERGITKLEFGKEYHMVVTGVILNFKNEILITKRAPHKLMPLKWELPGGSVVSGETSLQGILRELKEELGLEFAKKEAMFLQEVKSKKHPNFKDMWVFRKNVDTKDITFPDNESIDSKWVTIEEFIKMYDEEEILEMVDFGVEEYNKAIKLEKREAYTYIGKIVNVKMDRPLGTLHPKHGFKYEANYGYIPNTVSGDGEELDAYVLGVNEPLDEFEGECIAVIHRTNDDDDKLIVVSQGFQISDQEIRRLTNFQEKFFESEIIR